MDMSSFVDVPTFTSRLKEGYEYYAAILEESFPNGLKPKIAPVGLGQYYFILRFGNCDLFFVRFVLSKQATDSGSFRLYVDRNHCCTFSISIILFLFFSKLKSFSCHLGGEFFVLETAVR